MIFSVKNGERFDNCEFKKGIFYDLSESDSILVDLL